MNETVMLTREMLDGDPFNEYLDRLKEQKERLYTILDDFFEGKSIRKEMFLSLCNHAAEVSDSVKDDDLITIVETALDGDFSPECLEWVIGLSSDITRSLTLDMVVSVMRHLLDEGLFFSDVKGYYEQYRDNPGEFNNLLCFKCDDTNFTHFEHNAENANSSEWGAGEVSTDIQPDVLSRDDNEMDKGSSQGNSSPELPGMFTDMLHVISEDHCFDRDGIREEIQQHISRLSSLFSEVFSNWSAQCNETERICSLYKIQLNVLKFQQKKINEMSNIIADLKFQLSEADKRDQKRQEMKKKISEMQDLISFGVDRIGAE